MLFSQCAGPVRTPRTRLQGEQGGEEREERVESGEGEEAGVGRRERAGETG